MAKIPVICTNCRKEFSCDTEKGESEAFRPTNSTIIIIGRCAHCGHLNRIEVPSQEG
jgi:hypothetical protein